MLLTAMAAFGQATNQPDGAAALPLEMIELGPDSVHELSVVEVVPEFPGGMDAMYKYLAGEIHYPDLAVQEKAEGKVFVQFVVDRDGSITNVRVVRGVRPDLDAEAVRAVADMPAWSPGLLEGEPVKVRFTLPISFVL